MGDTETYLRQAIELAHANVRNGGRPFGAVIVKNSEIVATGVNEILRTNDPTAHAELSALRAASQNLGMPHGLSTASVYAELAKPFTEQAMKIRHVPVSGTDLYVAWKEKQALPS